MIYLLAFFLIIEFGLAYLLNHNSFVSLTIISIGSFLISSVMYGMNYGIIGADISMECMLLVVGSLLFMMIGENFGNKITISYKKNAVTHQTDPDFYYDAPKSRMIVVFLFMLVVFAIRFFYLYRYSLSMGNSGGLLGVIATVRLSYALGEYTSSSLVETLAIYASLVCEIYAYVHLYYYLYNAVLKKIQIKRLLLPIVGYCIIAISFTGRTQYIQVAAMVIWMLIYLYAQKTNKKYNNQLLIKKILTVGIIGVLALFLYGSLTRNLSGDSGIIKSITAYIGCPLYCFDQYKDKGFYGIVSSNKGFGFYTLQNLRSFINRFGAGLEVPSFHHLPFCYYANGSSNIYTSLMFPYQDFGVAGLFITRFLIGFIAGLLEKKIINADITSAKTIMWIIFVGILYYDGISAYIADQYTDNLADPITLIKYTIFSFIVIKYVCKCKKGGDIRKWDKCQ